MFDYLLGLSLVATIGTGAAAALPQSKAVVETYRCAMGISFSVRFRGERATVFTRSHRYELTARPFSLGPRYGSDTVAFAQDDDRAVLIGAEDGPYRDCVKTRADDPTGTDIARSASSALALRVGTLPAAAGSSFGDGARPRPSDRSTGIRQGDVISLETSVASSCPPPFLDGASLFLDLDGTLLELLDRPDEVVADDDLRALLLRLSARLDGRIAIVSGRSLAQLDAILGPVGQAIALSGSHGCEHRWRGVCERPERPTSLDVAAARFGAFAAHRAGVMLEEKSFGVALHYRMAPDAEAEARSLAAGLAGDTGLEVQPGKMMVELRRPGSDKGDAVRRLMRHEPMSGSLPVFVGDDITDETAFEAARALGGYGVLAGPPRESAARFRLPDPAAVRAWLSGMAA